MLSHAGKRILPAEELNFLKDYSQEKFRRFCQFALVMSQNGDKGGFGGSMVMTHAFRDHRKMRRKFRRRYGRSLIKENIECLVWKEAHRVDDFVAKHNVDLNALMEKNEKLRFIMPIRNPIHVALSFSERAGFRRKYFSNLHAQDPKPLLDNVLEKMKAAIRFQQTMPERMLVFFEDEIGPDLFVQMAELLKIRPDQRWLRDAVACFEVKPPDYQIPASLLDYYKLRVSELFGDMPKLATRFLNYGVK